MFMHCPKGPSSPDLWFLVPKMTPKSYNGEYLDPYPEALRTHILRLLGLKTILYKAFGPF